MSSHGLYLRAAALAFLFLSSSVCWLFEMETAGLFFLSWAMGWSVIVLGRITAGNAGR